MLAETFRFPVKNIRSKEGTAPGAAILVGVGVGIYQDVYIACESTICNNGMNLEEV